MIFFQQVINVWARAVMRVVWVIIGLSSSPILAVDDSRPLDINGYWQVRDGDQSIGILHLQTKNASLYARGIRINVANQADKIRWTCEHGDALLRGKAIWGGGLLHEMQSGQSDKRFYYHGTMLSAVGCKTFRPEMTFYSAREGVLFVPKSVDLYSFDINHRMDISYSLTKISREQALHGCQYRITQQDKEKWGDLVNSEEARQKMLKSMKLTKEQWLNLANADKICMDQ